MIIVKLSGGLGNQMFQYACGRALSNLYNVPLKLDHTFLEDKLKPGITPRDYELSAFAIDKKITQTELREIGLHEATTAPYKTKFSFKRLVSGYKFYTQKDLRFNEIIFEQGPNAYISGYFQNEKYFVDIAALIRTDFTFIPTTSKENISLANRIESSENAVSVHVRRGDFLFAGNEKVHFTCTPEYYMKAFSIIKSKIQNPEFFIFSDDDPQWIKDNLKFDAPFELIGNQNQGKGYEDMRLMSLCKHQITANSSFSWWAAWLNNNPNKMVVTPKHWVSLPAMEIQLSDIVPSGWIRI